MKLEKKEIEERKKELKKQHDDLLEKINKGKEAIRSMETNLIIFQGAIQQCEWTLNQYKEGNKK